MPKISFFKSVFIMLALMFSFEIKANDILGSVAELDISKETISQSLQTLKAMGKISEADYQKALAELNKMQDKDISSLINKAKDIAEKDPKKLEEMKKKFDL